MQMRPGQSSLNTPARKGHKGTQHRTRNCAKNLLATERAKIQPEVQDWLDRVVLPILKKVIFDD
jgi:hypothetical protein